MDYYFREKAIVAAAVEDVLVLKVVISQILSIIIFCIEFFKNFWYT